jgi:hypothetical protein
MLAMTTTIFWALYCALVVFEVLALLVVGDVPIFLAVRCLTAALLLFCRYLRHYVGAAQAGADARKTQFFSHLLRGLLTADTALYALLCYALLSWARSAELLCALSTLASSAAQLALEAAPGGAGAGLWERILRALHEGG